MSSLQYIFAGVVFMLNYKELKVKDLKPSIDTLPDFISTKDIMPFKSIIGQKRAEESIDLGLKMDKKGYNIFISGHSGTGKTGYIVRKIEEYAKNLPAPLDWCYVFNFDEANDPIAIPLETGTSNKFKEDMAEFVKYLFKEVPIYFNTQSYDSEKNLIVEKFEQQIMDLSEKLTQEALEKNFNFKETPTGEFVFIPLYEDKEMDGDVYAKLSSEEKEEINKNASELRLSSIEIMKKTKQLNKKMDEELKALDDKIAENIIEGKISHLRSTYGTNEKIEKYFDALKKDIIDNISAFLEKDDQEKNSANLVNSEMEKMFFRRYEVNVLVCNDKTKGAPVVFADSAEYGNIFGKIQYENKAGNFLTDFTLIRQGSLHLANGGYLLIKAQELLKNAKVWDTLKKCINLETIFSENSKNDIDLLPIMTLNPENIPLKTKIILLGSNALYSLLLENDTNFEKLFKIKAEFDSEILSDEKNTVDLIGFISNYLTQNNLRHITRNGIYEILKYSSRMAENKNYFSASMSKLLEIVDIADYYAQNAASEFIDENHIKSAILEKEAMHGLTKKKVLEMYKSKKYVVELNGTKVGQINGLSVMDLGDVVIGQQHRITVTTFAGKKGVINIEREADMSGSIHDKGIMILSGFVGEFIGQEAPIAFNASIVFEQLYSGIEGDSASAAELLALLSSLSDIPLKQSLAITGSVNQKGEIQPIGGVNEKIEGYFDICSILGLDGTHGVIIPVTNEEDLVLNDKVIDAVEKGLFHIYTVSNIEQCFTILAEDIFVKSVKANVMEEVKQKILSKIKKYNNILKKKTNS